MMTSSSPSGEVTTSGVPPLVARGGRGLVAPILVLAFLENASESTIPHIRSVILRERIFEGIEVSLDFVVLLGVLFLVCLQHAKKHSFREVVRTRR